MEQALFLQPRSLHMPIITWKTFHKVENCSIMTICDMWKWQATRKGFILQIGKSLPTRNGTTRLEELVIITIDCRSAVQTPAKYRDRRGWLLCPPVSWRECNKGKVWKCLFWNPANIKKLKAENYIKRQVSMSSEEKALGWCCMGSIILKIPLFAGKWQNNTVLCCD